MEESWKDKMARYKGYAEEKGMLSNGNYRAYKDTGRVYEWDEEERQFNYVGNLEGLTLEEWKEQYED